MRCFISIDLPEKTKAKIFHEFEKLRNEKILEGNFVRKENLHITIKFLGEIDKKKLKRLNGRLRKIKFSSFEINLGRGGFFGYEGNPRVLWVGVSGKGILELENKISNELNEFKGYSEGFHGHITGARTKRIFNKEKLFEFIEKLNLEKISFIAKEFILMKSELTQKGVRYHIIETFPLENRKYKQKRNADFI